MVAGWLRGYSDRPICAVALLFEIHPEWDVNELTISVLSNGAAMVRTKQSPVLPPFYMQILLQLTGGSFLFVLFAHSLPHLLDDELL